METTTRHGTVGALIALIAVTVTLATAPPTTIFAPGDEPTMLDALDAMDAPDDSEARNGSVSQPACAPAGWWQTVQQDIERSEYHVTWQEKTYLPDVAAAFQAPNRAHNLRTYFTPEGIRVVPRTGDPTAWQWGLTLTGYGYDGHLAAPAAAKLVRRGNRMEYQRGDLVEWYINDSRGLEQGFTIEAPMSRTIDPFVLDGTIETRRGAQPTLRGSLRVAMQIEGNLTATLSTDGETIEFQTAGGVAVLHYGGLQTIDATGRSLPTRFELNSAHVSILVDDSEAIYPITIDPLAVSPSWTAEGNQTDAGFGFSVATAGDVNGDKYSDVIVGAIRYDGGANDEGRALCYNGTPAGLSLVPSWTTESNQAGAYYGSSVATAGDVDGDGYSDVIVGAPSYSNGQAFEGAAFVFHGSSGGLSPSEDWFAEFDFALKNFGDTVSTAGDVNGDGYSDVIIEVPGNDQAYVWYGSPSGLGPNGWPGNADWFADLTASGVGGSVGTAGDVNGDGYSDVIVGSISYTNGQSWEGGAFVWHGSAAGLGATGTEANADWSAEGGLADANFGSSVGTAGNVNNDGYADVIVGANGYSNGQTLEGAAFVYHGSATGLDSTPSWTVESNQDFARFGASVATGGDINGDGFTDVIVGGARYVEAVPAFNTEGWAYVYFGSRDGLSTTESWTESGGQADAAFGHSVCTAGDVDGDGYADVIIGAPGFTNGHTNEGRACLYLGSPAGLQSQAGWVEQGNADSARFGHSVGTAGDVNGDGFADVIVGADQYDGGAGDAEGGAWVYHGSGLGLDSFPSWSAQGQQPFSSFGEAVGTAGDVNGDGYDDVIVGANGYENVQSNEGRAFVYHGSSSGLSPVADWTAESNQASAFFGDDVGTAGDVNGDGYSDVIIGAHRYDHGQFAEGAAFVWHGSAAGLGPDGTPANADWSADSNQANASFGISAGTAGDVDGDGYSDVIVGAPGFDNGELDEGAVFAWRGSASGLGAQGTPGNADWSAQSNQVSAALGVSTATAGDVNGDGFADVIVGAYLYDDTLANEGAVFLWYGSSAGPGPGGTPANAVWADYGGQADANLGISVGTAGDVNGDGYADAVAGAHHHQFLGVETGTARAYYGSSTVPTLEWLGWAFDGFAQYGISVGTAGDVNGDGFADIIVGEHEYDLNNQGRAHLYYGNNGRGLTVKPRQRRADESAPIAYLGKSDSASSFRLGARGRTPFGRGKVKLEWEVKPLGTPFDGSGTGESASWTDTGTGGVLVNELVTGLAPSTVYHWRVRLLYHPATVPFQQHSRWFTLPWNGWQEAALRTPGAQGDVDGDGVVDVMDLVAILVAWGPCAGACPEDLDGDGQVGVSDLVLVLTNWT